VLNPRTTFLVAVLWAGAGALLPGSAQAAQLGLSWSDNSVDEDGFLVERREASAGAFAQIAVLGPNISTYLDSTIAAGGSYCYRVRAFNSAGMSAYTNEACSTAMAGQTLPLSVSLNKSTFSRGETLVSTVNAVGGLINTPVDAYVVVDTGGGFLSLQLDGRLVPGLVPIARGLVLPTVSAAFAFPLAGAPPGAYTWMAAVTTPGTLTLVSPIASTRFTIVP
jgi:hypothetical protein